MNNPLLRNCTILLPLAALLGACETGAQQYATHYWQETKAKTEREYKIDHTACSETHQVEVSEVPQQSPSFEAYHDCMVTKGYVLRTY